VSPLTQEATMSKRQRTTLPFRAQSDASIPRPPVEVRECSDKEKLLYARAMSPVLAAQQAAQIATVNTQVVIAEAMMEWAGLTQDDGWQLNPDKMRWERRKQPA
jgi:hypothetical protein